MCHMERFGRVRAHAFSVYFLYHFCLRSHAYMQEAILFTWRILCKVLSCSRAATILDIAENRIQMRLLQPLLLRDMKILMLLRK